MGNESAFSKKKVLSVFYFSKCRKWYGKRRRILILSSKFIPIPEDMAYFIRVLGEKNQNCYFKHLFLLKNLTCLGTRCCCTAALRRCRGILSCLAGGTRCRCSCEQRRARFENKVYFNNSNLLYFKREVTLLVQFLHLVRHAVRPLLLRFSMAAVPLDDL